MAAAELAPGSRAEDAQAETQGRGGRWTGSARDAWRTLRKGAKQWRHSLHACAAGGDHEGLMRAVAAGGAVDALGPKGKTPLMIACQRARLESVAFLLDRGANVFLCTPDRFRTCLHYAAKGGDVGCVQLVLLYAKAQHADTAWGYSNFINWKDKNGVTALHFAAASRNVELVRLLLREGAHASLNNSQFRRSAVGTFPLHWAASTGNMAVIKELLLWGAERNLRDRFNTLPFEVAERYGHLQCASVLRPRAKEPLNWPHPWEDILPRPGSAARELLERALKAATRPVPDCTSAARAAPSGEGLSRRSTSATRRGDSAAEASPPLAGARALQSARAMEDPCWTARHGASISVSTGPASGTLEQAMGRREGSAAPLWKASTWVKCRRRMSGTKAGQAWTGPAGAVQLNQIAPAESEGSPAEHTERADANSDKDAATCFICCTRGVELGIQPCNHQLCSLCFLALCCHCKPAKVLPSQSAPSCPFCRTAIASVTPTLSVP